MCLHEKSAPDALTTYAHFKPAAFLLNKCQVRADRVPGKLAVGPRMGLQLSVAIATRSEREENPCLDLSAWRVQPTQLHLAAAREENPRLELSACSEVSPCGVAGIQAPCHAMGPRPWIVTFEGIGIRGNHLSNTTCLTQGFFKGDK